MDNQENDRHKADEERCRECYGSGACDPCDGYGFYPDSYPGAGDGPECEFCDGSGECPTCHATTPAPTETAIQNTATQNTVTQREDVIPR